MKREHVIVGGGIVGVCVAYFLASAGREVVLLDRSKLGTPPPVSSSGVSARMFRSAYGPNQEMTELCTASFDMWRQLQDETGEKLFDQTGWVIFEADDAATQAKWPEYAQWPLPGFARASADVMRTLSLPFEWVSADALIERYPQLVRNGMYDRALIDHTAGLLHADAAVTAIARLARAAGAEILEDTAVLSLETQNDRVHTVTTTSGDLKPTESVILAAGCMNARYDPQLRHIIRVVGERTMYVRPEDLTRYTPERFPVVGHFAFPLDRAGMVHISPGGSSEFEITIDPNELDPADFREPANDAFERRTREVLADWVPELAVAPLVAQRRCFYPVTPHDDYLLYRRKNLVTLVACASGTGFKTAPVTARIGADLAMSSPDLVGSPPYYRPSFALEFVRKQATQ